MIDIELIRRDPEAVRQALLKRLPEVDLNAILALDSRLRELRTSVESLRAERNRLSKQIGVEKKQGKGAEELVARVNEIRTQLTQEEAELETINADLVGRMEMLPNIPADYVAAGGKEANKVVSVWGEPPKLSEQPFDHVQMCERLGL